ncbi:MAG: NAD(P)H-dependent oxidoreductase [Vulcanimicrobiaceae bacterium]
MSFMHPRRIVVIQGHPDPQAGHFGHALTDAYAYGAHETGHHITSIRVAELDFTLIRTKQEWDTGMPPPSIQTAQATVAQADHLLIAYPLWLGTLPAHFKGFLEQLLRPHSARAPMPSRRMGTQLLVGKSARIIVTMGMPAFAYRWYFGAHSVRALERSILGPSGVQPIRVSLIGSVETAGDSKRKRWLANMRQLGRNAR